jgi:hypothetical protein
VCKQMLREERQEVAQDFLLRHDVVSSVGRKSVNCNKRAHFVDSHLSSLAWQ